MAHIIASFPNLRLTFSFSDSISLIARGRDLKFEGCKRVQEKLEQFFTVHGPKQPAKMKIVERIARQIEFVEPVNPSGIGLVKNPMSLELTYT